MILHRIVDHLKKQDWTAIALELGIVIIGVFIGTQVSNWNQQRIEKRETARLLQELRPALQNFANYFATARPYYATTRSYSDTAFAGWRGDPKVNDEQFVIAAYQASQIYTFNVNGNTWAAIFGGDRLRDIEDADVRRGLTGLMTFNYDSIDLPAIATPYRDHVRGVVPEGVQDAIRDQCGDRSVGPDLLEIELPSACDLNFPDARLASAAKDLRAHPELANELRSHRAAVAAFFANLEIVEAQTRKLQRALDKSANGLK